MEEAQLLSYLSGKLSEQENLEVEDWVSCSEENRRFLKQIYYTSRLARCVDAYEQADVESAIYKFRKKVDVPKQPQSVPLVPSASKWARWKRYGVAAAAFLSGLVVAAGVLLSVQEAAAPFVASTQPGQRAKVMLPDGTSVWLNASTRLTYESGGLWGQREAHLEGEAYFDVEKDFFKPFVVTSKGVRTRVLGTKFNVRAHKEEQQVVTTLFQGAVQTYPDSKEEHPIRLVPGQTLRVDVATKKTDLFTFNHPEDVLLWIKGELRFTNKSLGDIMECLAKVYNIQVRFEDEQLKNERFTCFFKTDTSLEKIMSTLALTKHFSFEVEGTKVMIRPFK